MNSSSIQFFDNTLPGLEAGTYSITVTPTLNVDGSQDDTTSQQFMVQGPRFSLPANEVSIQSPAPQSSGEFDTQLPYVLLNSPTLPWERALSPDAQTTTPWLALLVFQDGELQLPPAGSGSINTGTWTTTVSEFLGSASSTTVVPLLPVGSVSTEEQALTCQSIQFPATLFKQIAPQLNELSLLAHCRQVSSADQKNSTYGVVLANRFPKAMKDANQDKTQQATIQPVKNIAHLVSLEGCESYLSADYSPEDGQSIRLLSLSSWSFICMPYADQNFGQLLTQLMTNAQTGDNIPLLRMVPPSGTPADAISPETLTYLTNGYTPHLYKTLSGETTLGWYRGPLTPVVTPQIPAFYSPPQNPTNTSSDTLLSDSVTGDELFIYNADTGIYDVSYAAAWQIGRQLALADPTFTQALMAFFKSAAASTAPSSNLSVTKQTLIDHLQNGLVDNIGHMLNQPSTNQPPRLFQARLTKVKISPNQRREQQLNALKASPPMTIPSTMVQWLAQLRRFSGLPFTYLLPEEKLLPTESIRFFHVDTNWLDAMTAGALTIGIHNGQSKVISGKLFDQLKSQGFNQSDPVCGFFLRSAVVSGWPNLRVEANVTLLSSIQLAPDVLFCLFDGVPQQLTLAEPYHQLSFGVSGDTIDTGFIELRNLTRNVGTPLNIINDPSSNQLSISSVFRPGNNRIIDFSTLTSALTAKGVTPSAQSVGFSSSDMAIELIRSPEEVTFTFPSATLTTGISSMLTTRQKSPIRNPQELSEQSSGSTLLTYAITNTTPNPIQIDEEAMLTITVDNNTPNNSVDLQKLCIQFFYGTNAADLTTSDSTGLTHNVSPSGVWQSSAETFPGYIMLTITPISGVSVSIEEQSLSVTFGGTVNNQMGTCNFYLSEYTGTDVEKPIKNFTTLSVSKSFNAFSLTDFIVTPANVSSSKETPVRLTWNVVRVAGDSLQLEWGGNVINVLDYNSYPNSEYTAPLILSETTTFTLTGSVPTSSGNVSFPLQTTVSVYDASSLLQYRITSIPDPIKINESVVLTITVDNTSGNTIDLQELAIQLPVGIDASDLTSDFAGLTFKVNQDNAWNIIPNPDYSVVITPISGDFQPIKSDSLSISITGTINNQLGACNLGLTEVTGSDVNSPNYAYPILSVAKSFNGFSLTNFVATPEYALLNTSTPVTLTWDITRVSGCSVYLSWGAEKDQSIDVTNINFYQTFDLSQTTIFTLNALVPDGSIKVPFQLDTTVLVTGPGISSITGSIADGAPKLMLGNAETLSWTTTFITSICSLYEEDGTCIADGLIPDVDGTYRYGVRPEQTTTYHVDGFDAQGGRYQSFFEVVVYGFAPIVVPLPEDSLSFMGCQSSQYNNQLLYITSVPSGIVTPPNSFYLNIYDLINQKYLVANIVCAATTFSISSITGPRYLSSIYGWSGGVVENDNAYFVIAFEIMNEGVDLLQIWPINKSSITGVFPCYTLKADYLSFGPALSFSAWFHTDPPITSTSVWGLYIWTDPSSPQAVWFDMTTNSFNFQAIDSSTVGPSLISFGMQNSSLLINTNVNNQQFKVNFSYTAISVIPMNGIWPIIPIPPKNTNEATLRSTAQLPVSLMSESQSPENADTESNETKEDHIPRRIGFFDQAASLSEPTTNRYSLVENSNLNDVNPPVIITHCCTIH